MIENEIQGMMLSLIEIGSFNGFDGKRVHGDLVNNAALWDSASMYPEDAGLFIRDLRRGSFHCDALYIISTTDRWAELKPIVESWRADHITVITDNGTESASRWDSEDCESYKYSSSSNQSVSSFLGSGLGSKKDERIVIRLWWD